MKQSVRKPLVLGYLCALGAAMGYGGSQVVAKQVIAETEPLIGSAFTLLFGLMILSVLTARDVKQQQSAPKIAYIRAILAGLASAGGVTFLYLALSHAPVVNVAPVTAMNPLFSIALAQIFLRDIERLTPRILAGAILAIAGVIVISVSAAA
jgi:drug/metabolite transporter (DMT)-like permease